MKHFDYVIVGAGVSGLSLANWLYEGAAAAGQSAPSMRILERENEAGGYCRTVRRDGFVWDYSGHFFHFRQPGIEAWLGKRMPDAEIRRVVKSSKIRYAGRDIEFPFQKNIHQLPKADFIDCLHDMYFRDDVSEPSSFKEMLYARFGAGICERFLVPYNEKLYACDLDALDAEAMGRFFPYAKLDDIVRNMKQPDNGGYNATFSYPTRGAMEYIDALCRDLPPEVIELENELLAIDCERNVVSTTNGDYTFGTLVSSMPFPRLAGLCGIPLDSSAFTANKVLVYNLGFDSKGRDDVHWMYFPDRSIPFYRVGWYDNILASDRMSLYVELGKAADEPVDVEQERHAVLEALKAQEIVTTQTLVAWHSVVLDPAYVHINQVSQQALAQARDTLAASSVYTVGRYGGWRYCSIEDNILETRELAVALNGRAQ